LVEPVKERYVDGGVIENLPLKSVIAQGIAAGELPKSSDDGLTLAFCCLMDQHINILSRLDDSSAKLTPELADWLIALFLRGALAT